VGLFYKAPEPTRGDLKQMAQDCW